MVRLIKREKNITVSYAFVLRINFWVTFTQSRGINSMLGYRLSRYPEQEQNAIRVNNQERKFWKKKGIVNKNQNQNN